MLFSKWFLMCIWPKMLEKSICKCRELLQTLPPEKSSITCRQKQYICAIKYQL
jgi:hypothetical protein